MNKRLYICPKCGHNEYIADSFQATGGNFARMFDVQNKRFTTISCAACGYTELYRKATDRGLDILDFLLNGGG
ncbi:MAG: zinc ribbon domain-containing protein [Oscillospiraceae bacterium]|nr:zinc ribbon domain-containing protein [Oscillospiraceae bacterium]